MRLVAEAPVVSVRTDNMSQDQEHVEEANAMMDGKPTHPRVNLKVEDESFLVFLGAPDAELSGPGILNPLRGLGVHLGREKDPDGYVRELRTGWS